jgi:hypothetical protein
MGKESRSIKCEVPKTIWPVLVHTKHQNLIDRITVEGGGFDDVNPNISVRLHGIINIFWPLNLRNKILNDKTLVFNKKKGQARMHWEG